MISDTFETNLLLAHLRCGLHFEVLWKNLDDLEDSTPPAGYHNRSRTLSDPSKDIAERSVFGYNMALSYNKLVYQLLVID